jgi:hypothetical protein
MCVFNEESIFISLFLYSFFCEFVEVILTTHVHKFINLYTQGSYTSIIGSALQVGLAHGEVSRQ